MRTNQIPPEKYCTQFFREELKKVHFAKGDDGLFYTFSVFLDKDTLRYSFSRISVFRETTLKCLIRIYATHYLVGKTI